MPTLVGRKTAVIGGGSGIGLATAQKFAERNAAVVIAGRNQEHLNRAAEHISGPVTTAVVDATDVDSLNRFFAQTGPLDDLVVTATRRGGASPVQDLPKTDLRDAFLGKPIAHLQAVSSALDALDERGSVTLVGAASAQAALPGTAALAAVNGAVERAVPVLARELAPRRVNAVSPGVIETSWWDEVPEDARAQAFAQFAEQTPLGHNGSAEDVAGAIVALVENDYITGVVLPCDGGLRLT